MWSIIGKYALKFGVWCIQNPQLVDNGFSEVETVIADIKKLKTGKAS